PYERRNDPVGLTERRVGHHIDLGAELVALHPPQRVSGGARGVELRIQIPAENVPPGVDDGVDDSAAPSARLQHRRPQIHAPEQRIYRVAAGLVEVELSALRQGTPPPGSPGSP